MGLIEKKRAAEAFAQPNPGSNTKRNFINVNYDFVKSPVDFERTSERKPFYEQVPRLDGPHDQRFNPFNNMPKINSKYLCP